jgi:hypothetical protein
MSMSGIYVITLQRKLEESNINQLIRESSKPETAWRLARPELVTARAHCIAIANGNVIANANHTFSGKGAFNSTESTQLLPMSLDAGKTEKHGVPLNRNGFNCK